MHKFSHLLLRTEYTAPNASILYHVYDRHD